MPRTFTAAERAAIQSGHMNVHARLELSDPDGNWVDVSTGLGGGTADWFNGCTIEDALDADCMTMRSSLLRDLGAESLLSLSPLREDSTLNRDEADAYAPMVDAGRSWRVSVAVVEHGVAPASGDWRPLSEGEVDDLTINDPDATIDIVGRDFGARLLDRFIVYDDGDARTYGGGGETVETVIQEILDDQFGASEIVLYTPESSGPAFEKEFTQAADMSVMAAIQRLARNAGMVCRYRYDASDVFRLTLYFPDRESETPDWTLGPDEYTALPLAKIDRRNVRNDIRVTYHDPLSGSPGSGGANLTVTAEDSASITRYGRRILLIDLSDDTNVTVEVRAQAFADLVLADMKDPALLQEVEAPGFWIPQMSDFGALLANGVHYDTDQVGGVTGLTFRIEDGTLRTTLRMGGQPRGKYRTWVAAAAAPGPDDKNTMTVSAAIQSTSATQVVVRVSVTDSVPGNGDVALSYTAVACAVSTPASPQTIDAGDVGIDMDDTGSADVTIDRPASGSGTGRVVFFARRNKRVVATDAIDVPEQAAVVSGAAAVLNARFVQTSLTTDDLFGDIQPIDSDPGDADSITVVDIEPTSTSRLIDPAALFEGVGSGTPTSSYATTDVVSVQLSRPDAMTADAVERFLVLAANRPPVTLAVTVPMKGAVAAAVTGVVVTLESDAANTIRVTFTPSGDYDHYRVTLDGGGYGTYNASDDTEVIDVETAFGWDLDATGGNIRTVTATVELHDASHVVLASASSAPTNFAAADDI